MCLYLQQNLSCLPQKCESILILTLVDRKQLINKVVLFHPRIVGYKNFIKNNLRISWNILILVQSSTKKFRINPKDWIYVTSQQFRDSNYPRGTCPYNTYFELLVLLHKLIIMSDIESEDDHNIHNPSLDSMSIMESHRENQEQFQSVADSKSIVTDQQSKQQHHSFLFGFRRGIAEEAPHEQTPKKKRSNKKILQREESDFNFPDPDGRTLLHRSALEQNIKLINDVIDEFTLVLEQTSLQQRQFNSKANQVMIQERINRYVNQKDKFKLTPILLCCFKNLEVQQIDLVDENKTNERFECISGLFKRNADLNVKNPRTLWSPMFWCAYYGDSKSVQFILDNHGICFEPDAQGLYPLDHAGNKGHREVSKLIIEYLVKLLDEFQRYLNNQLFCGNDDAKHIFYQDLEKSHKKMLQIPILPAKILYWICYFNLGVELVEKVMKFSRVYFNVKLYTLQRMTSLHVAAQANIFVDIVDKNKKLEAKRAAEKESHSLIKKILEYQIKDEDEEELVKQYEEIINTRPRLGRNHVHQLTKTEKEIYDNAYKKEIIQFAKWEREFYSKLQQRVFYRQDLLDKSLDKSKDQSLSDPKVAPQTPSPPEAMNQEDQQNIDMPKLEELQSSNQQGESMRLYESIIMKPTLELDIPDIYGNTPLHWASLKGNKQIVELFLEFGANMELENQEFFKARELSQYDDVLKLYEDKLQAKLKEENKQLVDVKEIAEVTVKSLYAQTVHKVESEDILLGIKRKKTRNKKQITQAQVDHKFSELEQAEELIPAVKELFEYTHKLFVPDYVIKLQLKESDKSPQLYFTYLSQNNGGKNDSSAHQSLNFQISLLQNAGFVIYLMKSYNEQGFHYIMLKHEETKLEEEAEIMQLQVKLIDGYDLEPFKRLQQDQFEPFRSRQRQEIIEGHVKRIINLEQLQKAQVFHSFYRMHTFGGIERLDREWISQRRWYWPQPFCQIANYVMEGQTQNFQALTTMRLYLGEKISFYFAWKSYLTCALLFIALPGLALQIYILIYNQYQSEILPYWVFYVCLWSTLQVEFWKRKTSEINTRWGCIDLMENEDAEQKILRDSFIGDEEISDTTGELTKHQKKSETIILLMISFPVLSIFVGMAIAIFLGVQFLQDTYAKNDDILRIILGVLQGVGITILNLIYTFIAKWFVQMENHKYRGAYETSLIYKNVLFKLINSYLSIFYFIFTSEKTLKDIFFLMLPVLIVKQVNYMILSVFVPQALYQREENKYFRKIQKTTTSQFIFQENQRKRRQTNYLDPIQQFYKARLNINHRASSRAVIKVESDETIAKRLQEGKRMELEQNLDIDAVELNSLKLDFEGTLNYFMEGIIDYGYITLFAAAFPIGPAIAMIVSVPEIRMKVYSFLYVYKRPNCDRCSGIGEWLNVIELMSMFGVFSNFTLLYFKQRQQTLDIYQSNKQIKQNNDLQILFFILSIVILMLIKAFFKEVIPDKPIWVCQEIEKMKKKQDNEAGRRNADQLKILEDQMDESKRKLKRIRNRIKLKSELDESQIRLLNLKIDQLRVELQAAKKINERSNDNSKVKLVKQIGKNKQEATEYDMIVLGGMTMRYYQIELQLLVMRLNQLERSSSNLICVCQECSQLHADVHCIQCQENMCIDCHRKLHLKIGEHKVLLVKDSSTYDTKKLDGLYIYKRINDSKMNYKYHKEDKKMIEYAESIKSWKKIEYFSIPTYQKSEYHPFLLQIYNMFYDYYLRQPGLDYRTFQVDPYILFNAKQNAQNETPGISPVNQQFELEFQNGTLAPIVKQDEVDINFNSASKNDQQEVSQEKDNRLTINTKMIEDTFQYQTQQKSQNILGRIIQETNPQWRIQNDIIRIEQFCVEDKLFLNRLAFLTFKRHRHLTLFQDFYDFCKILQEGLLEQRVLLLSDMIDVSDDGEISKDEVARLFIPSIIQDMAMIRRVGEIIDELVPKDKKIFHKKDLSKAMLYQCQGSWLQPFIQSLLQVEEKASLD